MCVIIYVPQEATIDREELVNAWITNPDGAGFSVQKDGKVHMERGFMDMDTYISEVQKYIGKYNIVLHFRISTSLQVNRVQTHPYIRTNIGKIKGDTTDDVICMNGVVRCEYTNRLGWNDTMNFIEDYSNLFHKADQEIIDLIEEATGSKWFIMRPNEFLASKGFVEKDGKLYSNTNHIRTYARSIFYNDPYFYEYDDWQWIIDSDNNYANNDTDCCKVELDTDDKYNSLDFDSYEEDDMTKYWDIKPRELFKKTMIKKLKKEGLWGYILDFMRYRCNSPIDECGDCEECFETLNTKAEIKEKMINEYGI